MKKYKYSIIAFVILAFIGVGIWIKPLVMSFTGFPKSFALHDNDEFNKENRLFFYLMMDYYGSMYNLIQGNASAVTMTAPDQEYLEKLLMKEYYAWYQESKNIPELKNKLWYNGFRVPAVNIIEKYKNRGNSFFENTYPKEFITYINMNDSNVLVENVFEKDYLYLVYSQEAAIRYIKELARFYNFKGFYSMHHTIYFFYYYLTILENPRNENKAFSDAVRKLLKNEMLKKDSFFKSDINFFKECRRDNPKGKEFDDLREELGIIEYMPVPKSYVNMSRYSFRKKVESFIDWIMEYEEPLKKDKNTDL